MKETRRFYRFYNLLLGFVVMLAFAAISSVTASAEFPDSEPIHITTDDNVEYTLTELEDGTYSASISFDTLVTLSQLTVLSKIQDIYDNEYVITAIDNIDYYVGITKITFSEGITKIKKDGLDSYYALNNVVLPSTLTNLREGIADVGFKPAWLASYPVENGIIYTQDKTIALYVNSVPADGIVTFNSKCKSIAGYAMFYNTDATKVVISDNITDIGNNAFQSCVNITAISIGTNSKLEWIGYNAFNGVSVTEIYLPERVFYTYSDYTKRASYDPENATPMTRGFNYYGACLTKVVIGACTDSPEDNGKDYAVIPAGIFENCNNLETVDIQGKHIKKIAYEAFAHCSSLKNVTLNDGLEEIGDSNAFNGCVSLEKIVIPSSVKTIAGGSFAYCTKLETFTIPTDSKLEYLNNPFTNTIIKEIYLPEAVFYCNTSNASATELCDKLAYLDYTLSVDMFKDNTGIEKIVIGPCEKGPESYINPSNQKPYELAVIGSRFASSCPNLKVLEIKGTHIQKIAESAFYNCKALKSVTLNDGLEEIGNSYAFYGCASLEKVVLPSSVKRIADKSFANCAKLETFTIPTDSKLEYACNAFVNSPIKEIYLPEAVFYYNTMASSTADVMAQINSIEGSWTCDMFSGNTNIEKIVIGACEKGPENYKNPTYSSSKPYSIAVIPARFAQNCTNLKVLDIQGTHIQKIAERAFYNCSSLETVNLNKTLLSIGDSYAFGNCSKLGKIDIPASVEIIGFYSFAECNSLTEFNIPKGSELEVVNFPFGGAYSKTIPVKELYIPEKLFYYTSDYTDQYDTQEIHAFCNLNSLEKVTIGVSKNLPEYNYSYATKISIPYFAFANCQKLRTVIFEEGTSVDEISASAFQSCPSIRRFNLPDSVKMIGEFAFDGCTALKEFNINKTSNLTRIGYKAFGWIDYSPTEYKSDTVGRGYTYFTSTPSALSVPSPNGAPIDKIYIPKKVLTGGGLAVGLFAGSEYLRSVEFEKIEENDSITYSIPYQCFAQDTALSEIKGLENIDSIAVAAFVGCGMIENISLKGISNLGYVSFASTGIHDLTIVDSIKSVEVSAFANCLELKNVTIETTNSITSYQFRLLFGVGYNNSGYIDPAEQNTKQVYSVSGFKKYFPEATAVETVTVKGITEDGKTVYSSNAPYFFAFYPSLTTVNLPEGLKKIEDNLFLYDFALKNINMPNSIEQIGNSSFEGCALIDIDFTKLPNIKSIGSGAFRIIDVSGAPVCKISEGLAKQRSNTHGGLSNIILPNGIKNIGSYAFFGQRNVKKVVIPESIDNSPAAKYIADNVEEYYKAITDGDMAKQDAFIANKPQTVVGAGAFQYLNSLEELEIYGALEIMNAYSFNSMFWNSDSGAYKPLNPDNETYSFKVKKIVLGPKYSSIGIMGGIDAYTYSSYSYPAMFYGCEASTIDIRMNMKNISDGMFGFTNNLTKFKIPNTVTNIGDAAFYSSKIKSIDIPESVNAIEDSAFSHSDLGSINIPDSVTSIGDYAFAFCKNLKNIDLPSKIDTINYQTFVASGLEKINIPANVTTIASQAFDATADLECVTFETGSKLSSIEYRAFYKSGISNIVLPKNAITIASNAFESAKSLNTLVIPNVESGKIRLNASKTGSSDTISDYSGPFGSAEKITCGIDKLIVLDKDAVFTKFVTTVPKGKDEIKVTVPVELVGDEITEYLNDINITVPRNVTIYGYNGSTAEEYASLYGNKFVALNDPAVSGDTSSDYVETVNVVDPTCEDDGYTEHVFVNKNNVEDAFSYKDTVVKALSHEGDAEYVWSDDYTSCCIKYTCVHDASHRFEVDVPSTLIDKDEPDCDTNGSAEYEVSYTNEYGTFSDSTTETVKMLGHKYTTDPEFVWNADHSGCSVNYVCSVDESHKTTVNATVTVTKLEANCKSTGKATYTARVLKPGTTNEYDTDVVVETIEKAEHKLAAPVIENKVEATTTSEGHYDVVFYCVSGGEEMARTTITVSKLQATPAPTENATPAPTEVPADNATVTATPVPSAVPTVAPSNGPVASTPAPAEAEDMIKVGEIVKDAKSKASYKVVSVDAVKKTAKVTYLKPNSKKVKKATVPASITAKGVKCTVTGIAAKAFSGCKKLKNITIKTTKLTAKSVGKKAFAKVNSKVTVKVPKKKVKAYKKIFKKKGLKGKVK